MKIIKSLIFLLFIVGLTACHKDKESLTKTTSSTPDPTVFEEVNGDVLGYVYDEANQPVQNATVSIYNATTTTNQYGMFKFVDKKLDTHGTYLKVEKEDYFLGSDYIYPKTGKNVSYVQLLSYSETGIFDAALGAVVNIEGGGTIKFEANSIADTSGNAYDGQVKITAKRINPSDTKVGDKMPGDLRAEDNEGKTMVLSSFAMVAVELFDTDGNNLNILEGKTAEIVFPLDANLQADAPDNIPLWYFDETRGLWIEDGQAIKDGNIYKGSVSHFSWWNCDAPFPLIHLCVDVFYANGIPLYNHLMNITAAGGLTATSYIYNGSICGKVPKDQVLTLNIINPVCDEVVYTVTVGPFSNDVVLDDIVLSAPTNLGSGQVVCDEDVGIANSIVVLNFVTTEYSGTSIIQSDENGLFELSYLLLSCPNLVSYSLFAYDPNTLVASSTYIGDINNPNSNIVLDLCPSTGCDFTVSFDSTTGVPCENITETITAIPSGSNNYSYLWSTAETTQTISITASGTYFVTVTDIDEGCMTSQGIEIDNEYHLFVNILSTCDEGSIEFQVTGGSAPYNYMLNGISYTDPIVTGLADGTYCGMVIDVNGCQTAEYCFTIFSSATPILLSLNSCNDSLYTFDNPNEFLVYSFPNGQWNLRQDLNNFESLVINVFDYGYNYTIQFSDWFCQDFEYELDLPHYNSTLVLNQTNTTCSTCDDGQIILIPDFAAGCTACNPGIFSIYELGSDWTVEYSTLNASSSLSAGQYIVVLRDLDTGCIIMHEEVVIL